MEERMDVFACGRLLGTASGWDQAGDHDVQFYDFQPAPAVKLIATSCLVIEFENGRISWRDDVRGEHNDQDLVTVLADLPRQLNLRN